MASIPSTIWPVLFLQKKEQELTRCTLLSLCCFWLLPTLKIRSSEEVPSPPPPMPHGKYPFNNLAPTSAEVPSSAQPTSCPLVTAKSPVPSPAQPTSCPLVTAKSP